MKKFSFLFVFAIVFAIINPFQAYAQWYIKYGVTNSNELTEAQCQVAMEKATYTSLLGLGLSIAGGVVIFSGSRISIPHSTGFSGFLATFGAKAQRAVVFILGGGIALIGLPTWFTGIYRKADIKKVLARFPAKVSLSPRIIQDFNHYSLGLSLAITF